MRVPIPVMLSIFASTLVGQSPPGRTVQVVKASTGPLEKVSTLQAEVFPLESTVIVPRVTGQIRTISVHEGDTVAGGDLLVELDCPDLVADLAIAQATAQEALTRIEVARNEQLSAKQTAIAMKAAVDAQKSAEAVAEVARRFASINLTRTTKLHERGAATLDELEKAQLEHDRSGAMLAANRAATQASQAELFEADAMIKVKAAELTRAQAIAKKAQLQADRAQVELDFATIKSPYASALVTRQLLDSGNLAQANTTSILEIMNVDKIRLRLGVPEVEASLVRKGTRVRIIPAHGVGAETDATITRTTGAANPKSRAMIAEIELDNPDGKWMPGALCHVELVLLRAEAAVTIPSKALVKNGPRSTVWTVEDGKAREVPIKLGTSVGRRIQILEGLTGGERVIIAGKIGLRAGETVRAVDLEN